MDNRATPQGQLVSTQRITISRTEKVESGKRVYWVERGEALLAIIRFFDRTTLCNTGWRGLDPHWALMHTGGRIDRFDTLSEARDEALKI